MPDGLHYASFNLDDGLSLFHVAMVETADGNGSLTEMPALKRFVSDIRERCEEPPQATTAELVGAYRVV